MYLEYLQTALFVRNGNLYEIVKPSCTQQGRVYLIHAIRGCKHQDSFQLFNAVHFCKKLTDDTLRYMRIASFSPSWHNHIQLIKEDDAGRRLLCLFEHVPDAAFRFTDVF